MSPGMKPMEGSKIGISQDTVSPQKSDSLKKLCEQMDRMDQKPDKMEYILKVKISRKLDHIIECNEAMKQILEANSHL